MAVLRIARMGNPALLQPSEPVADPTAPEIRKLAQDMQDTIEDIGASGLAAPQVFVPRRVVVYRMIASRIPPGSGLQPRPWTVMVNPVIKPKTELKRDVWERCLSVPGLHGKVPRYTDIQISYFDLDGKQHTHDATSSWAALLQHECDHLDGVLFPMRMTDLSLLAYNEEPGPLALELKKGEKNIDPLFVDLVTRWPGKDKL
ncbi:MAG: peptide deformylase [Betaproteobacteria bacterium]|jgi:peptide deformylase|nr:peptide deformylase [Betaproteobacteria bacterium]